ncbi:uncharacterized protein [Eurosta solidaginis]|uniref:uncharacterized protein n=1 Tax=Eurosta solidaginis TaxID=178769 RepID=UPI0035309A74
MWCVVLKTTRSTIKWQIGVVYHSPNTSDAEFIRYMGEMLDEYFNENGNNVIGDFNINMNVRSTYSNQLNQTFTSMSMRQLIKFNTRITESSQARIDLLYSNSGDIEIQNLENQRISDHETICIKLPVQENYKMRVYDNRLCWDNYTGKNLLNHLRNYDLAELTNCDIDEKVIVINNILEGVMDAIIFEKQVQTKIMNKWYDRELTELNKQKCELYKLAKISNSWENYNDIKRHYKRVIKFKKKKYMENKITINSNNQRVMWKCLKDAVNMNNDNSQIKRVFINNTYVEEDYEIARQLNQFFIESIRIIRSSIETIMPVEAEVDINRNLFELKNVSVDQFFRTAATLQNKYGGRKLLTEGVIKDSMLYLGYYYTSIVNESFNSGVFPACWKTSTIIPVEKVKGTVKPEEIRPINTLPSDEKIIEKIVKEQLLEYVNKYEIIISEQSGYTDAQKTHSHLYKILMEDQLADLFPPCSTDSLYCAHVNNIFDLYENNVDSHFCVLGDFNLNDLKLFRKITSISDALRLQEDLNAINDWASQNNLLLNISKCCHITFTKSMNILSSVYSITNVTLASVDEFRDLGRIPT